MGICPFHHFLPRFSEMSRDSFIILEYLNSIMEAAIETIAPDDAHCAQSPSGMLLIIRPRLSSKPLLCKSTHGQFRLLNDIFTFNYC